MRFKTQHHNSSIPAIDLIPMLNVMMSVLAFFILVSMGLTTSPQGIEVQLPKDEKTEDISLEQESKNLIITLKIDDSFSINDSKIQTSEQLKELVKTYLLEQKDGKVLLIADNNVSYQKVIEILTQLKLIGQEKVSLGITGENVLE